MVDFGYIIRLFLLVDYSYSDLWVMLFFFFGNLKEEYLENKNIKNGLCEDCLDDLLKFKVNLM